MIRHAYIHIHFWWQYVRSCRSMLQETLCYAVCRIIVTIKALASMQIHNYLTIKSMNYSIIMPYPRLHVCFMYAWSSLLQLASTTLIKIRIFNRRGLEATLQRDMIIKLEINVVHINTIVCTHSEINVVQSQIIRFAQTLSTGSKSLIASALHLHGLKKCFMYCIASNFRGVKFSLVFVGKLTSAKT